MKLNKILIHIGHPAHVHLLRNFINNVKENNDVYVFTQNIPIAINLLEKYNIDYMLLGKKSGTISGKFFSHLKSNYDILKFIYQKNINIGIGTSMSIAQLSKLSRMKSIILDDDDDHVQPLFVLFAHPFADYLLSPSSLTGKRKKANTIYYPGFHELAYLHPNNFKPDIAVLKELNLNSNEIFFILRFNSFKAHHDVGRKGLSLTQKHKLIDFLEGFGKVFVTMEKVQSEFSKYQISLSPEKLHSAIYYSKMLIGDSQTMASEASILGTPSIRCNDFVGEISYLDEQEKKYKLTYGFKPHQFDKMLEKIKYLLKKENLKTEWSIKRSKLLKDKINLTDFLEHMVKDFPKNIDNYNGSSDF